MTRGAVAVRTPTPLTDSREERNKLYGFSWEVATSAFVSWEEHRIGIFWYKNYVEYTERTPEMMDASLGSGDVCPLCPRQCTNVQEMQIRPGGMLVFDRGHGRLGIPPGDPSAHEAGDER